MSTRHSSTHCAADCSTTTSAVGPDALEVTDVRIWPVTRPESRVRALASLTLNGVLRVGGLRIVEGSRGVFVGWPQERKNGTDEFFPVVWPTDRAVDERLQAAVIARWKAASTT